MTHVPPAAELLAENVKLQQELLRAQQELLRAHGLLRRFASGNYNFRALRQLCEEAESLVSGAGAWVYGAGNSYADLDERVGVNRQVVVNQDGKPSVLHTPKNPVEGCRGCRENGWAGA